jgi:transposase
MEYCGIDLHQDKTEICVLDEEGMVIERATVSTTRKALTRYFSNDREMRVIMEAGGSSPWVSRLIEECGHDVLVCPPRRVRLIAESTLKTDEIDAEVLARLMRIDAGFLGSVTHRSEQAQLLRSKMTVRSSLVQARTKWTNTIKGILRGFGHRIPGGVHHTLSVRIGKIELPDELQAVIQPLVDQLNLINAEIALCEKGLEEVAAELPEVAHLRQIPGIGLIVALYFVLTIDDPDRFGKSRDVAAFFGLRPTMRSSAKVSHYGRITKEGDPEMRWLLIQAAHCHMRTLKSTQLKDWSTELAARKGKSKATVALARKIAVLMHRLWVTGEVYEAYPNKKAA